MEDLTGRQFGQYQIVAPLGEGGMAAVYKAYQPSMERFVAIKVLPGHVATSEQFLNRFRREAKLLAQLQHPNILPVFDYGEADGHPYIVMPFVPSGTLAALIGNQSLPLTKARRITSQIGEALAYAHARGMVHRDVKPSNVLVDESGNCLLTDFGLARMVESSSKLTSSGTVLGTPAYMSPEQGMGSDVDHRTDIYSLGVILYEMVTGRVPYNAETPIAIVYKHIQDPLPSARKLNPDLPEAIELILLKALAKRPEDRYQSMDEFLQALATAMPDSLASGLKTTPLIPTSSPIYEKAAPSESPATRLESQLPSTAKPAQRRILPWIVAAIGALGMFAIATIAIFIAIRMRGANSLPPTDMPALATSTSVSTSVPVPLLPTDSSPTETLSEPGFIDEFDGQLSEGWTWMAEDPSMWSVSDRALMIMASDASFDGSTLPPNILLRDAPAGDFEVTTSLRFEPSMDFQFAGLVLFEDKANVLLFGRAFCDLEETCVGDGIYYDNYVNGSITDSSYPTAIQGATVFLRLARVGDSYTGYYSLDGKNWVMTGQHTRAFSQARVGLMAAQSPVELPAVFDTFVLDPK